MARNSWIREPHVVNWPSQDNHSKTHKTRLVNRINTEQDYPLTHCSSCEICGVSSKNRKCLNHQKEIPKKRKTLYTSLRYHVPFIEWPTKKYCSVTYWNTTIKVIEIARLLKGLTSQVSLIITIFIISWAICLGSPCTVLIYLTDLSTSITYMVMLVVRNASHLYEHRTRILQLKLRLAMEHWL